MRTDLIPRADCINRIWPFVDKDLIKITIGIRRSGKSTLHKMVSSGIKEKDSLANIIFINFELLSNSNLKNVDALYNYIKERLNPNVNNYLFVDEIHEVPEWESVIRSLFTEKACDIFLTGSNSKMLSTEYSTYLSGRYVHWEAQTLSMKECFDYLKDEMTVDKIFDRYLKVGGFPILWNNLYTENESYTIIRDIFSTVINKDLISRHGIKNDDALNRITGYLCDNIGQLTSLNNIFNVLSKEYKDVSRSVVYSYVQFLEEAFFVHKVHAYDIKGKKILDPKYKFYLSDIGMKHALMGYRQEDISKHLENIVYMELRRRGYEIYVGEFTGKEIDFVAKRQSDIVYIQVAYLLQDESTKKREFGNLELIKDNNPKYVITMDSSMREKGNINGIKHIHILDFLTEDLDL